MPIPLVVIAVLAASAVIGATALNWNKIVVRLQGKCIAVLGERQVGKTSLISFMKDGWLPKTYEATIGTERYNGRKFELKDLKIVFKSSLDVSGGPNAAIEWKAAFDPADYVFYLMRIDRVLQNDPATIRRVERDLEIISGWMQKAQAPAKLLVIIGTYADKDPRYANDLKALQDAVQDHSLVKSASDASKVPVVVGSLVNDADAQLLVLKVFQQIQNVRQ